MVYSASSLDKKTPVLKSNIGIDISIIITHIVVVYPHIMHIFKVIWPSLCSDVLVDLCNLST